MKKLSVTLALLASFVAIPTLANDSFTTISKGSQQTAMCPCQKPCGNPCESTNPCQKHNCDCQNECKEPCSPCDNSKCKIDKGCPDVNNCWERQRDEIYCRLKLTNSQLCQVKQVDEKYAQTFNCLINNINDKKQKLCSLGNCGCSSEKKCLEDEIKSLNNEFKEKFAQYHKEIECILTDCQKKQYRQIKREYNKQIKKNKKTNCSCQ